MSGIALSQPGGVGAINTAGANPPVLQEVYRGIQCYPTFTGSTTTWTWSVAVRPVGSNASFSSPAGVRPVSTPNLQAPFFTCDKAGDYTLQFVDSGANTYTMNLAAAASSPPYPVLSVKDFGAKGDGISDDTAAILATAARVQALGGGVVYFPGGRYPIVVPSLHFINYTGVTFRGEGQYVSLLVDLQGRAPDSLVYPTFGGNGTGENAFLTFTDSVNCQVRDIGLVGAGTWTQADLGRTAVGRKGVYWRGLTTGCKNCSVERCYFTALEGEAVYADGTLSSLRCSYNHAYRCMTNIFNYGVGSFAAATSCAADDNWIEDPGGSAWQGGGRGWSFSRNRIWMPSGLFATSDMVLVANADGAHINDNIFSDIVMGITGTEVFRVGFTAGDVGCHDVIVRRNLFKRCRVLNTNNAAILRLGSDDAGGDGVLGLRVEDNDFVECGDADHVNFPNAVGIKVAGVRPIDGIIGNNRFDNRAAVNGLVTGVHVASGVPASNGVVIRPNHFATNITTPYSFTVAPGGGGWEGEYVSLGSPEAVVSAPLGATCHDRTNGELYVKKTGSGNTGWKLVTHA